jgi:hypothetical protein
MDKRFHRTAGLALAGMIALTLSTAYAREVRSPTADNVGSPAQVGLDSVAKVQRAERQAALVNQLVEKFRGEAASQFRGNFDSLEWQLAFGSRLFHQSEAALTAGLAAADIATMNANMVRESMAKHVGGAESVITLLSSPCRIVDTRFGGGGVLGPTNRLWQASAAPATIAAQGGNAAGCGTFPNAEFFLVYVTAVPPGAPLSGGASFLTLQHDPFSPPPTSTLNFYPGINTATFATPSCQGCLGSSTGGFYAYAASNTHVVIDLVGVGQPTQQTLWAVVNADGTLSRDSHAVSVTHTAGAGTYVVVFDRNVRNCAYNATIGLAGAAGTSARGFVTVVAAAVDVNGVFVTTDDINGAPAERGFHLHVDCP